MGAGEAGGGIGRDGGVRGADVRLAVDVVDGRGYVEGFFAHGVLVLTRTDMLVEIIAAYTERRLSRLNAKCLDETWTYPMSLGNKRSRPIRRPLAAIEEHDN